MPGVTCPNCGKVMTTATDTGADVCAECGHTSENGCDCDYCSEGETPLYVPDPVHPKG